MAGALGIDKNTLVAAAFSDKFPEAQRHFERIKNKKALPVYGHIVAGDPTMAIQESQAEYRVLSEQWDEHRYVLIVSGDSMHPEVKDGDMVLVENTPGGLDPKRCHMKICAVLLNGESTLKRVFIDKKRGQLTIQLKPDNPLMPAYTAKEEDEFQIQGIVLEIIKRRL